MGKKLIDYVFYSIFINVDVYKGHVHPNDLISFYTFMLNIRMNLL